MPHLLRTLSRFTASALVALGCLSVTNPAAADKPNAQTAVPLTKIVENVYVHQGTHPAGISTASLFVVGRDGVLLADGQNDVAGTRKLLEQIARVTDKPLKWYVVGSDHGDHTGGNAVLPKDVQYVVHPTSRAQLESSAATTSAGRGPVVVPPKAMSGDKQVIDIGGIEAQALFLGRAHTGGDLMLYLPAQKILFMSEVFLNRVFPALRSAYPSEWLAVMDRALELDVEWFVPGHGAIEQPTASRERLVEYRDALQYVIGEVRRLHKAGLSVEDARRQANWGPYREWALSDQQDIVAIRRIYDELNGKLPPASARLAR